VGIFFFLKKRRQNTNIDELIGLWTKEDDGSGLLAIFGWSLNFKPDNKGEYYFWEGENKENHDFAFEWLRTSKDTIKIKSIDSSEWDTLQYKIENVIGAYNSRQLKLTEINKSDFWNSPEPLFKRR